MRSVAINVGANTNEPGFRGPIAADGRFAYVPIPESEPIREGASVPTYGDLEFDLGVDVESVADVAVHLDPAFAGVHGCTSYTYGDPHAVKTRPLSALDAGDYVFFYATLSTAAEARAPAEWITPEWGAYVIGHFRLEIDPVEAAEELSEAERGRFEGNAHLKRDPFDARVLLYGDPDESALYDVAVPLSGDTGVDPNRLVTEFSEDSGKGPWWRRPLRFDRRGTETLLSVRERDDRGVG